MVTCEGHWYSMTGSTQQGKIKIVKTWDKLSKWQCETTGVKLHEVTRMIVIFYCSTAVFTAKREQGEWSASVFIQWSECLRAQGGEEWSQQPKGSLNAWGLWSMARSVRYLHLDLASNTFRIIYRGVIFLAGGGGGGRHESSSRICELNTTPKHLVEQLSPIQLTPWNQGWCVQLVWNGVNQSS